MDDKGINFPTFKERPEKVDIDMDILNDTIEYIRPAVQADGGDIKVISIDNKNIVNLELLGSCETCPMSPMTLKAGVEEAIKKQVPEINGIYAVNGSN